MALSGKEKQWILNNREKLSVKKMAAQLNVSEDEIKKALEIKSPVKVRKGFYLILFLIPVFFFLILEAGLRIVDYGEYYPTWNSISREYDGLNFDIGKRYFHNINKAPNSIQDVFHKTKPENSFRVFVLGGSSAAGYPFMPLGSFSRYIRKRLELMYPDKEIEAVNLSLTAVNSYTILDLVPDVLDKEPDLILIYAGHNEYYGALGVGSLESFGRSRTIVKLVMKLENLRSFQFVRNIMGGVVGMFASEDNTPSGTLMARMAKEKEIPYLSDTYFAGLDQFKGNLDEIVAMIKAENVPLVLSTLSWNLKDLSPFISEARNGLPAAKEIFNKAHEELNAGNSKTADSLFRYAKDLDMLRFRAPEEINRIVKRTANKYNVPVIDVDSLFCSISPENIPGDNLMTDHLHPTLRGFQHIGNLFYKKMSEMNYLPEGKPVIADPEVQDSITLARFHFSPFDSTVAAFKLRLLKTDYPFVPAGTAPPINSVLFRNNHIDSLAYNFAVGDADYEPTQRQVADYYAKKGDYKSYIRQMELLMSQFPAVLGYYPSTINTLLKAQLFDEALYFAKISYKKRADAFNTKWIGIITLAKGNIDKSIEFLETSVKFKADDAQVLYNLAGAYSQKDKYEKALETINLAIQYSPNYQNALNLKKQLEEVVRGK